jgi:hypothetical protein
MAIQCTEGMYTAFDNTAVASQNLTVAAESGVAMRTQVGGFLGSNETAASSSQALTTESSTGTLESDQQAPTATEAVRGDPSIPSSDGTCHLFRIPGELRNRINQFALSFGGQGLYVKEDVDYKPPMFVKELGPNGRFFRRGATWEERMYNYIQTKASYRPKLYIRPDDTEEVNQLKYVCRQLYNETRGVALLFNDLIFLRRNSEDRPAAAGCAKFLYHCSNGWKNGIQTIVVRSATRNAVTKPIWETTTPRDDSMSLQVGFSRKQSLPRQWELELIGKFLADHPNANMRHHIESVHNGDWMATFAGPLTTAALYRPAGPAQHAVFHRLFKGGIHSQVFRDIMQIWIHDKNSIDRRMGPLTNYRAFPHDEHFDEIWFRLQLNTFPAILEDILELVPDAMEVWTAQIRKWFDEGF